MMDHIDDNSWESFRMKTFPTQRTNLNSATLGTPSQRVRTALTQDNEDLLSFPLGQYELGRSALKRARTLSSSLFTYPDHFISFSLGATQLSHLLTLALSHSSSETKTVLTSSSEHQGGIGAFLKNPQYVVSMAANNVFQEPQLLEEKLKEISPNILFLSHVLYDTGQILPIESIYRQTKEILPDCLIIVDAAQSLGAMDIPITSSDIVIGSLHKWFFGPQGTGILWTRKSIAEKLLPFFGGGDSLDNDFPGGGFELAGGQNFFHYRGIEECLNLYAEVGPEEIQRRMKELALYFSGELENLGWHLKPWSQNQTHAGIISAVVQNTDIYNLYAKLNLQGVHVKCIKEKDILRFSIPYYESIERLGNVIQLLKEELCGKI